MQNLVNKIGPPLYSREMGIEFWTIFHMDKSHEANMSLYQLLSASAKLINTYNHNIRFLKLFS